MDTKDFKAVVKAAGPADGLAEGEFEAIVSVFGNVDSVGDSVVKGAFADDLKAWEESGDPVPVIWSHDWADPFSHVGAVKSAEEIDQGLKVRGALDLDNPTAVQVWRLLKGRRVTQFSFAYDVLDAEIVTKDGVEVQELRRLKLYEVGPTLIGANQATELLAAKARGLATGAKAGRVLSAKNVTALREARDSIDAVLATAGTDEPEEAPKNSGATASVQADEPSQAAERPPADKEPAGAKSAASVQAAARRARAVATLMQMS